MRPTPLALAAGLLFSGAAAQAQGSPAPAAAPASSPVPAAGTAWPALPLQPALALRPLPRGEAAKQLPIILRARSATARPDIEAVADGDVEFRRGGTVIGAEHLRYDHVADEVTARGQVRIERDGAVYRGPALSLKLQRFEGVFEAPSFEFPLLGAGGQAERVDFLDSRRANALQARYTSCPRDGSGDPDWVLETRRVRLDFERNEGVAEGAVLRFLGAPILALPAMSFPLGDERKSGWLPPSVNIDDRSGVELALPYYWNIAPQRDATLTPRFITRRGLGLDTEFRYLEGLGEGLLRLNLLPNDRVAGISRDAIRWQHDGELAPGLRVSTDLLRVSDDGWWKDFPDAGRSLTPRLLSSRAALEQSFSHGPVEGLLYVRAQAWQVLQDSDALVSSPYQRRPQLGLRLSARTGGLELGFEGEFNRFSLPVGETDLSRPTGLRLHALGTASWPMRDTGSWLVPKLQLNAAAYRTDTPGQPQQRARRVIPTFSVDTGLEFERPTQAFGRALRQTLEPRLLYVNTPYRAQSQLPNFDAAARDFNFSSVYTENAFSGVDRVSDAHQLTAGVTTRLVDDRTGAEALRLGLVQRYLFRDQRVTPQADGTADGPPLEQRLSDVLLLGSSTLLPTLTLETAVQYSPDVSRSVRSILGARWQPGPYRTLSTTYRFARGLSEQLELGWQWPLTRAAWGFAAEGDTPAAQAVQAAEGRGGASSGRCTGTWYAVGRVNYSLKDSRVTDAILGAEYDAGCWIVRAVAKRLSTGRSEATTGLELQLELVGLSRIGSNPLKILKDNIPGYRLLREDRRATTSTDE
ncbi:MAG: LPS-assembly protein LptD [Rubrivivax sp.]